MSHLYRTAKSIFSSNNLFHCSFVIVLLLVSIAIVWNGCASGPKVIGKDQAKDMLENDLNQDGKIDTWQYLYKLKVRRCEHDDDGDGNVDRIEYFDSAGRWQKEEQVKKSGSSDDGPMQYTGNMTEPKPVKKCCPEFPATAKRNKCKAEIALTFVINKTGKVQPPFTIKFKKTSGCDQLFIHEALNTIRKWEFKPALMNGKPVDVYWNVVMPFSEW